MIGGQRLRTTIGYHTQRLDMERRLHVMCERFKPGGVTCGSFDYSTMWLTRSPTWPTSHNKRLYHVMWFIIAIIGVFVKQLFDGLNDP